ncbi:ankyrin repeat-containing domain protein [Trichoderma barbatum]
MSIPEDPLERRRLQNRMAQRRFRSRQKNQEQRNAIELAGQIQSAAASLYSEPVSLEGRLEDFSNTTNTANEVSSIRGGFSGSLSCVGSLHENFALFDGSNRHDHFVGVDANGNCIPYAISEPVSSTISTSPSNSSTLDILGPGRIQHRHSSPALSDNLHFSSEDHFLESALMATNDLMKSSNFESPDRSNADTSPRASDACTMSDPGWLSALHMAARRGHGGIVRLLLQNCMDTNEQDSDGLTPLMHAVAGGHEEVVGLLLAHGARLGDRDCRRRSVLHWAVLTYREAVLRLLLKHAATDDPLLIDAYDDTGRTPLHAAIDSGFEIGVSILMEFGVNIHSRARKP